MKLLATVDALVLVISSLSFVDAANKGNWGLQCGPYTSGGSLKSGAPGPCINTCFAINCKKKPKILKYSPTSTDTNRRRSGCAAKSITPCSNSSLPYGGSGDSCDEYPVASSSQGGTGSILRCVPRKENSSQGGQLRAFISANNVKPGDTFRVGVVLSSGTLKYCSNSKNCKNDGFQFIYKNGKYPKARDLEAGEDPEPDFVDAVDGAETAPLSVYRTSSGHLVAGFDEEDHPLNSTIWIDGDDGGRQTIVEQLSPEEINQLTSD